MQQKSILIIGGGEIGLNQIRIAKKIGFNVIVTDKNKNAPGLKEANVAVNIDGKEIEQLIGFSIENKKEYNISAVYCGNDFGLLSVERIKQALNIPHNSIKTIIKCTNKILMKNEWVRNKILTPKGFLIKSIDEAKRAIQKLKLPIIVKPIDSSGSRGISLVKEEEELDNAIKESFQYTKSNKILVEKFIEGTHHDVNGFFYKKKFYRCGIMNRYFGPFPYCVPIKGYYPTELSQSIINDIYQITEMAAKSLKIKEGPVKADIILSNNKIYIYEISNRFHGDVSTAHLYTFCGSINPIELYMQSLYKQNNTDNIKIETTNNLCGWYALNFKPGKIKRIEGINEAKSILGVKKILLNKKVGEIIHPLKNTKELPGFVWISGKTKWELDKKYDKVIKTIKIKY